MRSPTWQELDDFFDTDGWTAKRETTHTHWEKTLPDGAILRSHSSHGKTNGPGANTWHLILRTQLRVTEDAFWEALRTRRPVKRPIPVQEPEPSTSIDAWLVNILLNELHYRPDDLLQMSHEQAASIVHEYWSKRP